MARPLRIELAGGWYHVSARGNERRAIFRGVSDRFHLLALLGECVERFGWFLHGYVLMDNHYHLLIETPEPNLSRGMQWLSVRFWNWAGARFAGGSKRTRNTWRRESVRG